MMRWIVAIALLAACGDNITPGAPRLRITAGDALRTTEAGGTAMFTVGYEMPPADTTPRMLVLTSTKPTEGTVAPATIQLRAEDEDGVLVIITGVDDTEIDGDQAYQIHIDAGAMGEETVDVTNEDDDDDAGVAVVTPTTGTTSEAGGTATFTVVLSTMPTADVTIPLSSSNTMEGTLSTNMLVFTTTNWNVAQTVTVTGQDDDVDDGDQAYNAVVGVATSTDPRYSGMNASDVALTNTDDDMRGFAVGPISGPTSEDETTASFTIVLTSEPTADVTIALSSDDLTEGTITSPASLTFTSQTWDVPQTVTVTGVDDADDDGDIMYTVVTAPATSTDTSYAGLDPADVMVTNLDNEGPGVTVTPTTLTTNESGTTAGFTVVLDTQPTQDVTIPIVSLDTTEGTVVPATLTFTTTDWFMAQSVTVTGVDDAIVDGDITYTVSVGPATSADLGYNAIDPNDVSVTNADDETAAIVLDSTELFVSEFGDTDEFTIVLNSMPTSNVTIPLLSSDLTEGAFVPPTLTSVTFTPANWDTPQTITVRGVDDTLPDGNIVFSIVTGAAISLDPAYSGLDAADVTVTNFDNETANVFVQARKTLATNEDGAPSGSATFRVRLTTTPAATVTCTLSSSDTTEGQVSPQTLVFDNTNFQTVTVTGIDDALVDGDVQYFILTAPCTSADPDYNQRNPRDVPVTNRDND